MSLYIDPDIIEALNELSLVEYVECHYTPMKKQGKEWVGLCPNHNERSPSFFVNNRNEFHCFGCGFCGTGVITFEQKLNTVPFVEAVQIVAENEKVSISESYTPSIRSKSNNRVILQRKQEQGEYLDPSILNASLKNYQENDYVLYLQRILEIATVSQLLDTFKIGTFHAIQSLVIESKKFRLKDLTNAVIFWYINENQQITYGKISKYNSQTGRRSQEMYEKGSVHPLLGFEKPEHGLFGIHQMNLASNQKKQVNIVESENTAIVLTALRPQDVWIATGSAACLSEKKLVSLKNKKIRLFPDKGQYDVWNAQKKKLAAKGYQISIMDFLETLDVPNNYDILDYVRDNQL
jgi:DNA primase